MSWWRLKNDEFNYVWRGDIEDGGVRNGDRGGFSGPLFTEVGCGIMFNLYTNTQEDVSIVTGLTYMKGLGNSRWILPDIGRYAEVDCADQRRSVENVRAGNQ